MDAKEKMLEENRIYTDLYNNVIPERFPVHDSVTWNYLMEYSGKDLMEVQYRYGTDECIEIVEKALSDGLLLGDTSTFGWRTISHFTNASAVQTKRYGAHGNDPAPRKGVHV